MIKAIDRLLACFAAILFMGYGCVPTPSEAWPASPGIYGGAVTPPPTGNCPKSTYIVLCTDGWTAAGLYWANSDNVAGTSQPTWNDVKTFAMNSGQTWTRPEPDRNMPGVQFPVGPNILDSAMTDIGALANGSGTLQGVSYSKVIAAGGIPTITFTKTCTGGDPYLTLNGLLFKDVNFVVNGNGGCITRLTNWTGMAGINQSLSNQNSAGIIQGTGSPSFEVSNYKLTYDPTQVHPQPEMFGTIAGADANIATLATFTGTYSIINDAAPGFLTVSGNTGTMYRSAYIDWPGRVYSSAGALPIQTEYVQLLWNAQWIGRVICSGSTCTIQSTAAGSPNAQPTFNSSNPQWMSWGVNANSTPSRQGVFLTGTPNSTTFTLSGSPSFGSTPTDVAIGSRSCTGSGCNGTVWLLSCGQNGNVPAGSCYNRLPAAASSPGGAMSMSASPATLKGFGMVSSVACGYYKSRFAYSFKGGNDFIGRGNCPVDIQGSYINMSSGQIGYADDGPNRGGVPHTNGPVIEQVQVGFGTIPYFWQRNNFVLSDIWNVTGNITALGSLFANSGATGNNHVDWTSVEFADSLLVANRSKNNVIYDGTFTASSGNVIRYLGQGSNGTRQSRFTGTLVSNGGGTGKLHVTTMSSGTVAVNDWLLNCPSNGCQAFYTGPARITAQIATEPGDVSTWTTNYWYGNVSGQIDTYTYVPTIGTFSMSNNDVDNYSTGTGVLGVANEIPVTTFGCTNNFLMIPNTAYTGFGCK